MPFEVLIKSDGHLRNAHISNARDLILSEVPDFSRGRFSTSVDRHHRKESADSRLTSSWPLLMARGGGPRLVGTPRVVLICLFSRAAIRPCASASFASSLSASACASSAPASADSDAGAYSYLSAMSVFLSVSSASASLKYAQRRNFESFTAIAEKANSSYNR
jgi:hypothetical protein